MALNKDVLGQALYDVRNMFSNKTMDELIEEYGSLENVRLAACKKEAEITIAHFIANAEFTIPGTGLSTASGGGPVTGTSITGKMK